MKKWLLPLCAVLVLSLTACIPAKPPTESPRPIPKPTPTVSPSPGLSVHTDWSKLGDKPAPLPEIGGRWYEEDTDALIPREDYGMLVPYAGLRLMDDWPAANGCLWGLMTREGVAVTDPVFSNAYCPGYSSDNSYSADAYRHHPLLVLSKGDRLAEEDQWDPVRNAVAALDGSWCTDFEYRCVRSYQNGLLLFLDDGVAFMDPHGVILHRYSSAEIGLTEREFASLLSVAQFGDGVGGRWEGDYLTIDWVDDTTQAIQLFRVSTGKRITMPGNEWEDYCPQVMGPPPDGGWEVKSGSGTTVLYHGEETYVFSCETGGSFEVHGSLVLFGTGAVYTLAGEELLPPLENGMVQWVSDEIIDNERTALLVVTNYGESTATQSYYTTDGAPIPRLQGLETALASSWYLQVKLKDGLLEVLDLNMASYYDIDTMECVFRTYLGFDGT